MPSRVIEYRAIVHDATEHGHPIQAISKSMEDIMDWARLNCKHYNKPVYVYVLRENRLRIVNAKVEKKKEIEVPKHCLICGTAGCKNTSHAEYKGRVKEL